MRTINPAIKIPLPVDCSSPGTFAHRSIHERLPLILDRILSDHCYDKQTSSALLDLRQDLSSGRIRHIRAGAHPDPNPWRQYAQSYLQKTWDELPWFFAETYFYRRVLEAVNHFDQPVGNRHDPFLPQKQQAYENSRTSVQFFARRTLALCEQHDGNAFREILLMNLWGNRADLSLWPSGDESAPVFRYDLQNPLLIDHTQLLGTHLQRYSDGALIDMILDNAGLELVGDLCLALYLLETDSARTVRLHAKADPTFVSDTTTEDIQIVLEYMEADSDASVRELGARLNTQRNNRRLILHKDPYWNSPLPGWEMPAETMEFLRGSTLVILKGDANYRRLVGDRKWDLTTSFPLVCGYFPAPLACLRVLKSEVLIGLQPQQEAQLRDSGPDAFTSGAWGLLQCLLPEP
ncbi:MAG: protein-glutamate O-methyltransferase family protein [Anaerolineales bacterium]|nr:protein-glutamate O-methyltransferase family protein [Anaerolineales bacterium]